MAYGIFLTVVALRSGPGEALTGQWVGQPAFKAAMAVLLAFAAAAHPILREARWLIPALIFFSLFERRIVGGLTGAVKG